MDPYYKLHTLIHCCNDDEFARANEYRRIEMFSTIITYMIDVEYTYTQRYGNVVHFITQDLHEFNTQLRNYIATVGPQILVDARNHCDEMYRLARRKYVEYGEKFRQYYESVWNGGKKEIDGINYFVNVYAAHKTDHDNFTGRLQLAKRLTTNQDLFVKLLKRHKHILSEGDITGLKQFLNQDGINAFDVQTPEELEMLLSKEYQRKLKLWHANPAAQTEDNKPVKTKLKTPPIREYEPIGPIDEQFKVEKIEAERKVQFKDSDSEEESEDEPPPPPKSKKEISKKKKAQEKSPEKIPVKIHEKKNIPNEVEDEIEDYFG